MKKITIKEATLFQNGLIAVKSRGCFNSMKLRKIAFSGDDRGCIGQINRSGFFSYTGNINYDAEIEEKKEDIIKMIKE